jgi:acyl-coenzyme A thioesterase 13
MAETNTDTIGEPVTITEGEFAGWQTWGFESDPFETLTGPYYLRRLEGGGYECAFKPGPQNNNGFGIVHGGSLMTFADFALFAHARDQMSGPSVTVQFEGQFLGAAKAGKVVISQGEVTRATRSLLFVRGLMTQDGNPVFAWSGIIKKLGA